MNCFIIKEEPSGIVNITFGINGDIKNKLKLIAGPRGLNTLLREITREWVYKNYPILTPTSTMIAYHQKELEKLEKHLKNIRVGHLHSTDTAEPASVSKNPVLEKQGMKYNR